MVKMITMEEIINNEVKENNYSKLLEPKNKYQSYKEKTREQAINFSNNMEDYFSLWIEVYNYFTKKAKRYGLTKEFKENGII